MSKTKFIVPFAILIVLFALLYNQLSSHRANQFDDGLVGASVPTFSVPTLDDSSTITNKSLEGRVVLLNFFASWCGACAEEHPMLMKIKNEYHVPIYGIAFRDEPKDTKEVLQKEGNPYTAVGYDLDGQLGVDFGIYATPETFVISPSGKIIYKHIGTLDAELFKTKILPLIEKYQG